jgi:MFS family permease
MLYPVMPIFLSSIGFSSVLIGLLEGMAEATAGLSKSYFGRLSDASGRRLPFVNAGYMLSTFSKPMLALSNFTPVIFAARSADRLGKGIRTAARDAILSDECTPQNKGKVFGFHKAMDTTGAFIGPLFAMAFLFYFPGKYKWIFLIAFVPALFGSLLTFFVQGKEHAVASKTSFRLTQTFNYLQTASAQYRQLVFVLLLFALFNSSDLFLLMKIKSSGYSDEYVIGCYILYNFVFAFASFPLGHLGDTFGLKKTLMLGLCMFMIVYAGFGINTTLNGYLLLFSVYGIYAAATDGISKALISNLVDKSETASALGTYSGLSSVFVLLASLLAGLIWKYFSPSAVFIVSAIGAAIALALLSQLQLREKK